MGLLDYTGLTYYTNKLKSIFIRSVNGQTPVGNQGNVEITQVPLAENLYNDETTDSIASFIYRPSGGMSDIETGDAALASIEGRNQIIGRINESINFENVNDINLTCSNIATFRNAVNSQKGDYIFQYVAPIFQNDYVESWSSVGTWQYNNVPITSLSDDYGLSASGIINKGIFTSHSSSVTEVLIKPQTFNSAFSDSGNYTFTCLVEVDDNNNTTTYKWYYNGEEVSLSDYGITSSGNYNDNDYIMVIQQLGTPTSNCKVSYQPYVNGTYTFSTPETFVSTGFNQFNKDSTDFYISNATIDENTHIIIPSEGQYVCYCKAVAGTREGYIGYSEGGYLTGIGWCKNIPDFNTQLSGTETTEDEKMGFDDPTIHRAIIFEEDGYVVVSVTDKSDLCIHTRWDSEEDDVYAEYIEPDIIDFQHLRGTYDNSQQELPISSYGLPAITTSNQTIGDILDLRNRTYTQKIERVVNNTENMADVISSGQPYEYTNEYIYVVLESPRVYLNVEAEDLEAEAKASDPSEPIWVPIRYTYSVDDLATEEFTGTTVEILATQRYGENLRNKLKGNVLTISDQTELNSSQIDSIRKNFLNIIYPVGAIYISMSSTSPQLLWGGKWEPIQGRFLLATGANSTNSTTNWGSITSGQVNRPAGETGGEAWHTLNTSEMPTHNHSQASHNHTCDYKGDASSGLSGDNPSGWGNVWRRNNPSTGKGITTTSVAPTINNTGGGQKHNNMPPYLAVYMWKRTE